MCGVVDVWDWDELEEVRLLGLNCTALYCTALCCTVLCCTMLIAAPHPDVNPLPPM